LSTLFTVCAVATLSLLAFALAGVALAGLRGTCSRACDPDGRPLCGRCPRRRGDAAPGAANGTGPRGPR